jgi:hypothetical protein
MNPDLRNVDIHNEAFVRAKLDRVDFIFNQDDERTLSKSELEFLTDSRRATTDGPVRIRRSEFILNLMRD